MVPSTTCWPRVQAGVVLGGFSTGGAVVMSYLERSDVTNAVVGVVLDAPNIDFGTTVDHNAAARTLPVVGLPVPPTLTWVAKTIGSLRFGVDWGDINYVSRAEELDVPILILHGTDDASVPIGTSRASLLDCARTWSRWSSSRVPNMSNPGISTLRDM